MFWGNHRKVQNFFCPNRKKSWLIKMIKFNKDDNEGVVKLIDSARFMVNSLSNLVNNLAEGIQKFKCKDCYCFLEYESIKDNLIK